MSQSAALLDLLRDGQWWTTRDLLRVVPCIVHSRISDIRKAGHVVEHRYVGRGAAGSQYRLVGSLDGERRGDGTSIRDLLSPSSESTAGDLDHLSPGSFVDGSLAGGLALETDPLLEPGPPAVVPGQLSIEEAA